MGVISYDKNHWVSSSALNYASSWYEDGFFRLKGLLYDQAGSVEFSEPESRALQISVTPLFVLPLFVMAKLTGVPPNPWMLNLWNFILHGLAAYFIALLAYRIKPDLKENYRRIAFVSASFCCLFSYQLLYFFSGVYWTDQFLLPVIAAILLCELDLETPQKTQQSLPFKVLPVQQLLILLAVLCDGYGLLFALLMLIYFAAQKNFSRALAVFYPLALGCVGLVGYFSLIGKWTLIQNYFVAGLGMSGAGSGAMAASFFTEHLHVYALFFLIAFAVAERLQSQKKMSFKLLMFFFAAPLVYTFLFANLSSRYEFSVLKFYIPILVFCFALLPAELLAYADGLIKRKKPEKKLFLAAVALPALFSILLLGVNYEKLRKQNSTNMSEVETLKWVRSIAQPEQVIFSNELYYNYEPPQGHYILRKNIWIFGRRLDLETWRNVFRDAGDYPLLWIEKKAPLSTECAAIYLSEGAKEFSTYQDLTAYLFPSVKNFVAIKNPKFEQCL